MKISLFSFLFFSFVFAIFKALLAGPVLTRTTSQPRVSKAKFKLQVHLNIVACGDYCLLFTSCGVVMSENTKKWQCIVCGLIYDEALGWPDDGINPGTAWQDVPEDWLCPDCGVGKDDFEMIAI